MRVWILVAALIGFGMLSCSEDKGSPTPSKAQGDNPFPPGYEKADSSGEFTPKKMLLNVGVNILREDAREFLVESRELQSALQLTCSSNDSDFEVNWGKSQEAWKKAMLTYHRLEATAMGPLTENKADVQSKIYAWPYLNDCSVDIEVEARTRGANKEVSVLSTNVRGLGVLEYLLFDSSLKSRCNLRANPQIRTWNEKADLEKRRDRCHQAQAYADDIAVQAEKLDRGWDTEKGNYSYTLTNGTKYRKMDDAVTEFVHGLFSIEKLKDQRMARPLGLHKLCSNDEKKCPEDAEHNLSGLGLLAIKAQIQAFQKAFFGAEDLDSRAFGLDDYLIQAGHPEAAQEMKVAVRHLNQNLEQVLSLGRLDEQIHQMSAEDCKASSIQDRRVPLCALYQDVREITTLLKTDILVILSLKAPPGYQGDND